MGSALTWLEVERRVELGIAALRRLPYRDYLRTAHWQRVRELALERARHQCALCPATEALEVHHRSYARRGFEQPEDLVVLCCGCHNRHHRTLALVRVARAEPVKASLLTASEIVWRKRA